MQADPRLAVPRHRIVPSLSLQAHPVDTRCIHFSSAALISSVRVLGSFQPSLGQDHITSQERVSPVAGSPLLGRPSVLLRTPLRPSETWGCCLSQRIQESSTACCSPSRLSLGRVCQGCASAPLPRSWFWEWWRAGVGLSQHVVSGQPPLQALFPKFCPSLGPHFSPSDQTPVWILQTAEKHFHDSC